MEKVYFLNIDFGEKLTGIERSSLKRAHLFKNYLNITAIFLCSKLNFSLNTNIKKYKEIGWMPNDCQVINVYDDLREKLSNAPKNQLKYYMDDDFNIIDVNSKHQRYKSKNSALSMYIVWHDDEKSKLNYINFFFKAKKIRREKYDDNGYLYLIQYLDDNLKVIFDDIIDFNGNVVLKRLYNVEKNTITRIELYQDQQIKNIFQTEQELIAYWLKIFNPAPESLLIIDKNRFWGEAASQLRDQCKVVSVLHSTHLREADLNNVILGKLNSNYTAILESKHKVDAIVTLTQFQKDDLEQRYENNHKIAVIPHSLDYQQVDPEYKKISETQNIIAMCRLATEKQLEDMIQIMFKLKEKKANVRLYIYGEGSERQKLTDLIKELDLTDTVFLPGFVHDLAEVYQNAALSILTSKCEGFSLSILESLSYGVPAISYDIKYGPSSMIKHGENGYLFEPKDFEGIAIQIDQVLNNENLLKNLRKKAYMSSLEYTEKVVAEKWKIFLDSLYGECTE
jgi:poly(glycerol-phosphate) alpha-glucosyltransferase